MREVRELFAFYETIPQQIPRENCLRQDMSLGEPSLKIINFYELRWLSMVV